MSESGSTQFPRPTVGIDNTVNSPASSPSLLIVKLSEELQSLEKPTVIVGEVVERKNDGTIRIKTDQGEVIVKTDKPLNLRQGETIEIKIPLGDPPQTLTVRPAPLPKPPAQPQNIEDPQYIKLPQILMPEDLQKLEEVVLKPVLPQDMAKITIPYIQTAQTQLPPTDVSINPVVLPTISAETIPTVPTVPKTLVYTPPAVTIEDIALALPATPAKTPLPSSPTEKILDVPPATIAPQKDPSFLSKILRTEEPISKTILNILPVQLPLKSILAGLIAKPLEAPLPVLKHAITEGTEQAPSPPEPKPFVPLGPVTILSIQPPAPDFNLSLDPKPVNVLPPMENMRIDSFKAIVIGFTPEQNFPVLKIIVPESRADQFFMLELPVQDIPVGTQIEFASKSILPQPAQLITPSVVPSTMTNLAAPELWTTLQDMQSALTQSAPYAARAFHAIIPQAGNPQQIGPAALFFLAALRSGDLSSWLGDKTIEALKKIGKMDLMARLGREMGSINRLSAEPVSQDWKMTNLPLSWNSDIHKAVVYYKEDGRGQNQDDKKSGGGTRFLMNLNLSAIGPVQVDGLFRANPDDGGRLDLILRTQTPFSQPMQAEMRQVYKAALDETRYGGELSFQNKAEQWVHIAAEQKSAYSQKI